MSRQLRYFLIVFLGFVVPFLDAFRERLGPIQMMEHGVESVEEAYASRGIHTYSTPLKTRSASAPAPAKHIHYQAIS